MKKLVVVCSLLLLFTGCAREQKITENTSTNQTTTLQPEHQFQRISLESETLGDKLDYYIKEDTVVVNDVDQEISTKLPVYESKERTITEKEFQQIQNKLGTSEGTSDPNNWMLEGNSITGNFGDYLSGTATMSEEELAVQAQNAFDQIPFLEGDYVYFGICGRTTIENSEGIQTTRIMVTFCRVLDGVRVIGNDRCDMWFNDTGLVGIAIDLFDYEQIGTIDMIALEEAEAQIKDPDAFDIKTDSNSAADKLQVEKCELLLINQNSRGCNILQPVYIFKGTATLENGAQAEFTSEIIAIPEAYTYEPK